MTIPEPAYLGAHASGELADRVASSRAELSPCRACPRLCEVDRLAGETGVCMTGRHARVSSAFAHMDEEDCLRGWRGSGTIFFACCNLRCVFCQNHDISQGGHGLETRPDELAAAMLALQRAGCHNVNFVTPEHVVPQLLEALPIAIEGGLRIPLVYNTSAYDAMSSLRLLDGIVDIYMPDFKVWDPDVARRLLGADDYPDVARTAIAEMHRQVGDLVIDSSGLAARGLLVRHLVMPDGLAGTRGVARFLARELSPDTYINVMGQYHPAGRVGVRGRHPEIDRRVTASEVDDAYRLARAEGLHRFDRRSRRLL